MFTAGCYNLYLQEFDPLRQCLYFACLYQSIRLIGSFFFVVLLSNSIFLLLCTYEPNVCFISIIYKPRFSVFNKRFFRSIDPRYYYLQNCVTQPFF